MENQICLNEDCPDYRKIHDGMRLVRADYDKITDAIVGFEDVLVRGMIFLEGGCE